VYLGLLCCGKTFRSVMLVLIRAPPNCLLYDSSSRIFLIRDLGGKRERYDVCEIRAFKGILKPRIMEVVDE
jgi:hypothetical protein